MGHDRYACADWDGEVPRYAALDGIDGSGKTTQAKDLAAWFASYGYEVVEVREPGTTRLGDKLREILLDSTVHLSAEAELLLFMAARAQMIREIVEPALRAGKVVVSDRSMLSSLAYQCGGRGVPVRDFLKMLGFSVQGIFFPTITIILDVSENVSRARCQGRGAGGDRFESQPLDFQARVRAMYRWCSDPNGSYHRAILGMSHYPIDIVRVDANHSRDRVWGLITEAVSHLVQRLN